MFGKRHYRFDLTGPVADGWARLPRPVRWTVVGAFVALLFLLPGLKIPVLNTPKSDFASVLFAPVGIYVLLAVGLNVVVGFAGLLDLGYVAFFAIGAYTYGIMSTQHGWSFWPTLPLSVSLAMAAGVVLGTPTLRLRGDYLAIVTLGFGEIVRISANNTSSIGGPRGVSNIPHPGSFGGGTFLGVRIPDFKFGLLNPKPYYWMLLIFILVVVFFVRRLEKSRVGRAWTAIREDEDAAELMGVPTFRFKLWAFAIGAGIGGLGGQVYASQVNAFTPQNFQFTFSVLILAAVVLGGSGNLPGVILGGALVAYLPERFRSFDALRQLVFAAALVTVMVFRPQGLLPSRRRAKELTESEPAGGMGSLGGETGLEQARTANVDDA